MIDIHTKVLLANADDATKTVWLTLPFDEDDLAEALSDIGVSLKDEDGEDIDTYDLIAAGESIGGYYVADWQSDYLKEEHFSDIFAASDLVERIEDLESWQTDLLDADYALLHSQPSIANCQLSIRHSLRSGSCYWRQRLWRR